ncbi:Kelch-like ECH-associated protein 1 [Zootermopsis nevadensis]|uniref:Kelch-like ECH-associated protein 1 n=2 Tax=Zootermopsis nevadensis TaxID=136037 RepID=A0A067QGZ6_ZOONE|nr:Kelch-like ECH-associated protein 1 [Zootermopsis nevadensis]
MNTERHSTSAAVLNDKIYVAGGRDGKNKKYLNSVEVYDPDTNRWTFVAPMHYRRTVHSCVAFHGCLYVLGGCNDKSCRFRIEKYDAAEDTWTEIPWNIFYSGCTEVIDDMIFVILNYYNPCSNFNRVACFNDKENQWFVSLFV